LPEVQIAVLESAKTRGVKMADSQWLSDRVYERIARDPNAPKLLVSSASRAHKIKIDDACSYYFDGTDQEKWSLNDFPFLVPPFDQVWLEAVLPRTIVTELFGGERRAVGAAFPHSIAVLIDRADAREDGVNNIAADFAEQHQRLPDGTRHILMMSAFWEGANFDIGYAGLRVVTVRHDGSPCWHTLGDGRVSNYTCIPKERADLVGATVAQEWVTWITNPALLALSFLNCRNTVVAETPAPRAERRRRERAGLPIAKYHVLQIEAIRRAVAQRMAASGESKAKALHFCRGHFATYDDDHPLFGRYSGRFWRPAHTRGTVKSGVVVKDYSYASGGTGNDL
jgi:hypothetical protein